MLRKLGEMLRGEWCVRDTVSAAAGSAADLKKAMNPDEETADARSKDTSSNTELVNTLQQTITQMGCTIEMLTAKVSTMQDAIRHLEAKNQPTT